MPGTDEHYLPLTELFGKVETDEKYQPSLQKCAKKKSLPFVASVQHANNTGLLVQCEECERCGIWFMHHVNWHPQIKLD